MDFKLLEAAGEPPFEVAARLRALVPAAGSVREAVAAIVADVRARGNQALEDYTRRFDTAGAAPRPLRVSEQDLDRALATLTPDVRDGLEQAIANVGCVASAGLREPRTVRFEDGHEVVLREAPVARAAVYVPGGRAPYPSTVVMGVATARAARVGEIAVCSPPGPDGDVNPVVLGACRLTGANVVYRMGGAQAIAALAYGTETVAAVDVIVGPGNLYVQEAKQQVFGQVGIDGFAGPSDLLVIAGPSADPELVAADLVAQGEHGEATIVVAVSADRAVLDELARRLEGAPASRAVARLVHVADVEHALGVAEAFAPEHLQLVGAEVENLAPRVSRAGSLLVGSAGATAFGDYIAGSNHVLPTGGAARFASALSPQHFRRRFTEVRIGAAAGTLARAAAPLARAEGFEWHARSMEARIRDNGAA